MIHQPVVLNQRSHLLGHHNHLASPKTLIHSTSPTRMAPNPFVPIIQNPSQMHIVQGFQHAGLQNVQSQKVVAQRFSTGTNRTSLTQGLIIPAFLESAQGEREVDFKAIGDDFMRIKDIASQYCYKFRVTNQTPIIQHHTTDNLKIKMTFSGQYIEDLVKFAAALEDPRFSFSQGERVVVLEFRFLSIESKTQLIETYQIITQRAKAFMITSPIMSNYRSMSSILPNQHLIESTPLTIHTINQGQKSERELVERVQYVNVSNVPDVGINARIQNPLVPPPVQVIPFPVSNLTSGLKQQIPRSTQTQQFTQISQVNRTSSGSVEVQVMRLTQQNKYLTDTIVSVQQELQLVLQEKQRLIIELQNSRQQTELNRGVKTEDGDLIRLRTQVSQLSQSLSFNQRRLKEVQLQLSASKLAQVEAKNEKEQLKMTYAVQVSQLETQLNVLNAGSTGNSTETQALRKQNEELRRINFEYEGDMSKLQRLLREAEKQLIESDRRVSIVHNNPHLILQMQNEIDELNQTAIQKGIEIKALQQKLKEVQSSSGQNRFLEGDNERYQQLLENERRIFVGQYDLLRTQKDREIFLMTERIDNLMAEDNHKYNIIQTLEDKLNNLIHAQNLYSSNANLEATDKLRTSYEEEIQQMKAGVEFEFNELNNQVGYYQRLAEEYQLKYGNLLGEYQAASKGGRADVSFQSVNNSQNQTEMRMRSHINSLEVERETLIRMVEDYRQQLEEQISIRNPQQQYVEQEVTMRTYIPGPGQSPVQEQIVQRSSYVIDQQQGEQVQTEKIERMVYDQRGHSQKQTIQRVTYQPNQYGQQQQVVTYQLDDGSEKYIHKAVTERVDGILTHQVDTNVTVHRESEQITYDIETEETTYGDRQYQQGYSGGEGIVYNSRTRETENYGQGNRNVVYHGDNMDVVYNPQGNNFTVGNNQYEINIPREGVEKITITEDVYQETRVIS